MNPLSQPRKISHACNIDIFCKIVDNFGDIGVCWRLARQLHAEHHLAITLWIDDWNVAQQLIPDLNPQPSSQYIQGIHIQHWQANSAFTQAADVVIEAFGCELPATYMARMAASTIWINLEYLSAESWVADFHGRHSKRDGLTRYFFFPGFGEATGGLLREHSIVVDNQAIANNAALQREFFKQLQQAPAAEALKVSLFCYPDAPMNDLLNAMASGSQPIVCMIPATGILSKVSTFFGRDHLSVGEVCTHNNLSVHILPFLSQIDYDKLLASCDINFVRGEDSWIRAIWAGKPFIWQPYRQSEQTHLIKLQAFLDRSYGNTETSTQHANAALYLAWTENHMRSEIWQNYLQHLNVLQHQHIQQCRQLADLPDLASNLVIFIENLRANKI